MRKYAILKKPINDIKKVMIYESNEGVYLFLYHTIDDTPAFADEWYETVEEVEDLCFEKYYIEKSDWININDPQEYCQHDIIDTVRIKGKEAGKPQWGHFEKLINGEWVEITFK